MMYFSLRRRLLFGLFTVLSLLWLATAAWLYDEAAHEVEELFDINLIQSAGVLSGLLPYMQNHPQMQNLQFNSQELLKNNLHQEDIGEAEDAVSFIISDRQQNIIAQSKRIPEQVKQARQGLQDLWSNGKKWRVFTLQLTDYPLKIHTAEHYEHRKELLFEILVSVLMPLLLGLLVMVVLIWLTVNRSLQPLTRLAAEISQRDPTYLTPVKHNNIPLEIKSLVDALNQLFQRLSHAFDNERRFTADAAHELRTPLAGIKIQATVAKRSRDDSQRQQALDNINAGIDRTTHLVELDNKAYCFALKTTAWALNPNNAKRCWNASAEAHTNTSAAAAWVCRLCNALFNCINAN